VEPRGRNRTQTYQSQTHGRVAQIRANRCHRLPPSAPPKGEVERLANQEPRLVSASQTPKSNGAMGRKRPATYRLNRSPITCKHPATVAVCLERMESDSQSCSAGNHYTVPGLWLGLGSAGEATDQGGSGGDADDHREGENAEVEWEVCMRVDEQPAERVDFVAEWVHPAEQL
jgi:hypothetical protein